MSGSEHAFTFARAGGFYQVRLDTAADLAALEQLDLKLWAALACPVKGLELDEATLALIDTDKDGRVRAAEVIGAVQWCEDHLKDLAALKSGADSLPISQINDKTEGGQALIAAARRILTDRGKPEAQSISMADVSDTAAFFAQTLFNGDGIVPADATPDAAVKAVIDDVIACLGPVTDRSGKPGVNQANVDAFFAQCAALADHANKGADPAISPLGVDATAAAFAALGAVRAKIDDYFARTAMAAFDSRALGAVNRKEEEYLAITDKDLSLAATELAGFPLHKIEASKSLPLDQGLNPAWAGAMATLRSKAIDPLFGPGKTSLSAADWSALTGKLAAHGDWVAAKPANVIDKLALPQILELNSSGAKAKVDALLAQDVALTKEFESISKVEQLVRYNRDLYRLLSNFVNFSDFYAPEKKSTFQCGTLFLDQRSCDLCVRVDDAGKHAAMAGLSKCYLAYCDLVRPSGEKMQIVAAFTGGDNDYLMVGRNGLFYDRKGKDWDATITRVVENPISVRQAFFSPYKSLVRLIEDQVAKRAAAAGAESDGKIAAAATATANVDKTVAATPPAAAKETKKIDPGTVAAMGVAFGSIGVLIGMIIGGLTGLFSLPFWQLCLAVAGLLLLVSTPSMLIAWLKLRQRHLAPILDANGWAVNGRVKMNVPFGDSLTKVAAPPANAVRGAPDPFSEKKSAWPGILKFVVGFAFVFSLANHFGLVYLASDKLSGGQFTIGTSKAQIEADKAKEAREKAEEEAKKAADAAKK